MRTFAFVSALLAVAGLSTAQTIDPNSVDTATKSQWCDAQKTACPLLCLQYPGDSAATTSNTCDVKTLSWSCICAVNGLTPNASEYSQTIPYFECTEYGTQCVKSCGSDSTCASNCRTQHPCGAQNPTRYNITSSSSSMSATGTGAAGASKTSANAADYTGFGGSAASQTASSSSGSDSSSSKSAASAINFGQTFGLAIVVSGFFAGFALVL